MLPLDADTMKVMIRPVVEKRQGIMKSIADPQPSVAAGDMPPEPVGFRWYLHSSLPVSWLAKDVIPAIRYLRRTERMPVVNVRRASSFSFDRGSSSLALAGPPAPGCARTT